MKNSPKYTYKLRPAYGSQELLIEFGTLDDPEYFLFEIVRMLGLAGFESQEMLDLWMNDEIQVNFSSLNGLITVSLNVYGMLFIMSKKNQIDILKIDQLLQNSEAFIKEKVDFLNYRMP